MNSKKALCLALIVIVLGLAPTTALIKATTVPPAVTPLLLTPDLNNKSTPYNAGYLQGVQGLPLKGHHTHDFVSGYKNGTSRLFGYLAGQNDTRNDKYDPTDACQPVYDDRNTTTAQVYECLNGYYVSDTSRNHEGYLQGIQDIGLKGHHTQDYLNGYLKGIQDYWNDRGLVEGYNGMPISSHNVNYTQSYRDGYAERASGYNGTKACGIDLGELPTHTDDNYGQFYLGLVQGGDAYDMVDGAHYALYDGPPGHTAEYYKGWKFGYGLGLGFDSDCGGVAVVSSSSTTTAAGTSSSQHPPQENVIQLYQDGLTQANSGNYTGAFLDYQKALNIDPHNVKVLANMGRVLFNLRNYTGALQYLDKALKIDPSYPYALELKGILLYELGHFREALVSLDKALELEPYSYYALENKGLALYKLGDYTEALSALDKALGLNSGDEHALFNKGLVLATLGFLY